MRLPQSQSIFLKQGLLTLEPTSEVYLFGSRVHASERGGDIDILRLTPTKVPQSRLRALRVAFFSKVWLAEVGHRQLLFFRGSSFQADCFAASRSPMRTDPKELQLILLTHWDVLQRSLQQSTNKTRQLLKQAEFNFEELESIDSLTSKFSRTSDIYLQKVLRSIWMLLREDTVPLIDLELIRQQKDYVSPGS